MKSELSLQKGVGMIEVLVTLLLVGTSSLGLAALQARSLQYNHGAFTSTQANLIAYDLFDVARMNNSPIGEISVKPTAAEVTALIQAKIPGATGVFSCENRLCSITIQWADVAGVDADQTTGTYAGAAQNTSSYTFSSHL